MSTQPTMTEILPRIEQSIQRVVQAVTALPPAARVEPLLPGDRSVKDVLGHITWWDQWLLLTLPPAPGEPAPAITLPLADQIPPNDHWADEMNAKVLLYNKQRDIRADLGRIHRHPGRADPACVAAVRCRSLRPCGYVCDHRPAGGAARLRHL